MWEIIVLTKFIVSDSFCILLGRSTDPRESATFHAEYIVVLVLTWSGSPTQLLLENFPNKMGTMSGFDPILNPPHGQKVLKDSLHMNVLRNLHERTQAKMYKFNWPTESLTFSIAGALEVILHPSIPSTCYSIREAVMREKCSFFNIVQKAFDPPPPFVWTLCGEFFWRKFNKSA